MAMPEDLYREMQQRDEEEKERYGVDAKAPPAPRRLPNEAEAKARYEKEIAPVIARVKRAEAGLPLTNNPLKNLFLRLTGKDKIPIPVVVDATPGAPVLAGKSQEEMRQEMIANPEQFTELAKKPEGLFKKDLP
jgi:hypothetical protein